MVSLPLRCRPQRLSLRSDLQTDRHTDPPTAAGSALRHAAVSDLRSDLRSAVGGAVGGDVPAGSQAGLRTGVDGALRTGLPSALRTGLRSGLRRLHAGAGGGRQALGRWWRAIGAATGGALALLVLSLALLLPLAPALALSLSDLPAAAPSEHVLDQADVLSRAARAEIERQLQELTSERVDARLITVSRLDYGLDLSTLGDQLLERWSQAAAVAGGSPDPLLLLLIDTQTRAAAVVAAADLQRQLPASLLRSTARTTMAVPLRDGDRQRQAAVDALTRLRTVLQGGEDPGEPAEPEALVATSNVPSQEETRNSNAFTWVVVLLVVGSVVPMLTWWVFSR